MSDSVHRERCLTLGESVPPEEFTEACEIARCGEHVTCATQDRADRLARPPAHKAVRLATNVRSRRANFWPPASLGHVHWIEDQRLHQRLPGNTGGTFRCDRNEGEA